MAEPLTDADKEINADNKFAFISLFRPDENNKQNNYNVQDNVFGVGFGVVAVTAEGKYKQNGLRKILKLHFTDNDESQFPGVKLIQYVGYAPTARGYCMVSLQCKIDWIKILNEYWWFIYWL